MEISTGVGGCGGGIRRGGGVRRGVDGGGVSGGGGRVSGGSGDVLELHNGNVGELASISTQHIK